jgi:hypothetical protein
VATITCKDDIDNQVGRVAVGVLLHSGTLGWLCTAGQQQCTAVWSTRAWRYWRAVTCMLCISKCLLGIAVQLAHGFIGSACHCMLTTSLPCLPAAAWCCCCSLPAPQLVVQLAREEDRDGRRTIGVLTKADMIEPGTHDTWLPVLQVGGAGGRGAGQEGAGSQ